MSASNLFIAEPGLVPTVPPVGGVLLYVRDGQPRIYWPDGRDEPWEIMPIARRALAALLDQEFQGSHYDEPTDTWLRVCVDCGGLEPEQLKTRNDLTNFKPCLTGKHPSYDVGHRNDCETGRICAEARALL